MGSPNLESERLRRVLRDNVKAILASTGLSENVLAQKSGVSQKQINNITNARTGCGIDALDAIARALNVEPWQMLIPHFGDSHNKTMSLSEKVKAHLVSR